MSWKCWDPQCQTWALADTLFSRLALGLIEVRRYCVLCNDAQHIQKLKLTCAMLHARFVEVPRQAEKGKLSMILIAPILWMWFMDQQSLKIASVSMPVDCCHQTGNNKSLGEWQTDPCRLCVYLWGSGSRTAAALNQEPVPHGLLQFDHEFSQSYINKKT